MTAWAPWILTLMVAVWMAAALTHRSILNWTVVVLAAALIARNLVGLP